MVRRFLTISEIECTAQFVPGNPVAKESYRRLVGWYDFDVEELKCCVATASGGLCAHIHRKGWVVELTNSTLSIIGHICAGDKFGVDSQVVQDIGRAQNAIDEARLRADIAAYMVQRNEKFVELEKCRADSIAARGRLNAFLDSLGAKNAAAVKEQSRIGPVVSVIGSSPPIINKDTKEVLKERVEVVLPIGRIEGISAASPVLYAGLAESVRMLAAAYEAADSEEALFTGRKTLRELRAALSTHDNVVERLRQLVINCDAILASDLLPFCFLTPSWPDRVIPAKMMLDRMGKPNERPQAWLQRFEEELKSEYGVRTISVR